MTKMTPFLENLPHNHCMKTLTERSKGVWPLLGGTTQPEKNNVFFSSLMSLGAPIGNEWVWPTVRMACWEAAGKNSPSTIQMEVTVALKKEFGRSSFLNLSFLYKIVCSAHFFTRPWSRVLPWENGSVQNRPSSFLSIPKNCGLGHGLWHVIYAMVLILEAEQVHCRGL